MSEERSPGTRSSVELTPAQRLEALAQLDAIRQELQEQRELLEVLVAARGIVIPSRARRRGRRR